MRNTANLLYCRPATSYPVAPPARELDSRTQVLLEEMLCAFPRPKRMRVIAVFGDSETVLYAKQIHTHLAAAGWEAEPVVQIAAQSVPHQGVYIRMGLNDASLIEIVVGANSSN